MVRIVTSRLLDDIDKTLEATEIIHYTWEGVAYELHLNLDHANEFRTIMAEWVEHSAVVPETRGRKGGVSKARATSRDQNQKIREWARSKGMDVPERGRLRAEIVAAYRKEHES